MSIHVGMIHIRCSLGIFLLPLFLSCLVFACSNPEENDKVSNHDAALGLLVRKGGIVHVTVWKTTVTGSLTVKAGSTSERFDVQFLKPDSTEFTPGDPDKSLGWVFNNIALVEGVPETGHAWAFRLKGKKGGTTEMELRLRHTDHSDYRTPEIPVYISP